jgi:hypothetical protein
MGNTFEIFDGYCCESKLDGLLVEMRLNQSDFFESERTGLQIALISGAFAVRLNSKGSGLFKNEKIFARDFAKGERIVDQRKEVFPFY